MIEQSNLPPTALWPALLVLALSGMTLGNLVQLSTSGHFQPNYSTSKFLGRGEELGLAPACFLFLACACRIKSVFSLLIVLGHTLFAIAAWTHF